MSRGMASTADRIGEGAAAALLRARGVGKRFAGVTALDGVDFDLRAGEVHHRLNHTLRTAAKHSPES